MLVVRIMAIDTGINCSVQGGYINIYINPPRFCGMAVWAIYILFTDNACSCSYQINVVDEITSQNIRAGNASLSARKYTYIKYKYNIVL